MHGTRNKTQSPTELDDLAARITAEWRSAVASIINTGRLLIEAKKKVGHGNWLDFVEKLPFGDRTADCLMEIARHPVLSNSKFVSNLPPSWGTLHRLTYVPERELKELLAKGTITCETRRNQVDKLVDEARAGGRYRPQRLAEAVEILVEFVTKYPDPKDLVDTVYENYLTESEFAVSLSEFAKAPDWLTKFYRACKKADEASERRHAASQQAALDEIVHTARKKEARKKAKRVSKAKREVNQ